MLLRALASLAAVLLLSTPARVPAAGRYKPQGPAVPYEGYFATFPSGLRLVVYEMPQVDRFMLSVSYRAGAADDPAGREGLAHLAEHLAFRARPAAGLPRYWDQLQATGWAFNAFTSADETVYFESGKPEELRHAVALEAARMRDPLLGVGDDELAVEREVVISEYRERFETSGTAAEAWTVLREAFPAGHPYARAYAHDPAGYRRIGLADLRPWVKERYQPAGAVLVIASPMKAKDTAQLVLETFGALATGDGTPRPPLAHRPPELPGPGAARELVRRRAPVEAPRLWVAWPVPGFYSRQIPLAHGAAAALGLALRDVLRPDLFEGAVEDVDVGVLELDGAGLLYARLALRDEADAARLAERVKSAAAERLVDKSLDLDRAAVAAKSNRLLATDAVRERLLVEAYLELEQIDTVAVSRFLRATGSPDFLAAWPRMVAGQLGSDQLDGYAYQHLKRDRAVAVLVSPDGGSLPGATGLPSPARRADGIDELEDEGALPPPGAARALAAARAPGLDRAERRVLPNGLEVVVARRGTLPIAEVRLVVRPEVDGTEAIPAGVAGLALGGRSGWTAEWAQFSTGTQRSVRTGREAVVFRSRGTSANLDVLLEGAGQWVKSQRVEDFDERRRLAGVGVARGQRHPASRAMALLRARLFPGHPYGATPTAAAVGEITEKTAEAWLDQQFRPERATLVVVSNLAPTPELWEYVEGQFGRWRAGERRANLPSRPAPVAARTVLLLDRPGAAQALLLAGWQAPPPGIRDEAAFSAVLRLLQDRLVRRIRVEEGVSYGARVTAVDRAAGGFVLAAAAVERGAAVESLRHLLDSAGALAAAPVDPTAAARARWHEARRFGLAFDTVAEAAGALEELAVLRLGPGRFEALPASIASLDAARIQAAARALGVGREVVVVLGDQATLLPELQKAGLAPEVVAAGR